MITLRELRDYSHLTQKAFAEKYNIPLATYRKWEQGESTPAPYIVKLIADTIPVLKDNMTRIEGSDGKQFYYDKTAGLLYDDLGNGIHIRSDLNEVKPENLSVYIGRLFSDYRDILEKFERDCQFDKKEDIIWIKKQDK